MIVFTVLFSRMAKLPTEYTVPYALMVFDSLGLGPGLWISALCPGDGGKAESRKQKTETTVPLYHAN